MGKIQQALFALKNMNEAISKTNVPINKPTGLLPFNAQRNKLS